MFGLGCNVIVVQVAQSLVSKRKNNVDDNDNCRRLCQYATVSVRYCWTVGALYSTVSTCGCGTVCLDRL